METICDKYYTITPDEQLNWFSDHVEDDGYDAPNYTILIRGYTGGIVDKVRFMLENPQVNGVMIEIGGPHSELIDKRNIDRLILDTLDSGKYIFILCEADPGDFDKNYANRYRVFVKSLRKAIGSEALNNPNLFIIPSNFGRKHKPWFGDGDTFESVIKLLKSIPEWNGDDIEPETLVERETPHYLPDPEKYDTGCFINSIRF